MEEDSSAGAAFLGLLCSRNAAQSECFADIIGAYSGALARIGELNTSVLQLKSDAVALRELSARGDPTLGAKNAALEEKLRKLQDELTQGLRTQAGTAQAVLDSNAVAQGARKEAARAIEERDAARETAREATAQLARVNDRMTELDVAISVLKEDEEVLQNELVRTESRNRTLAAEKAALEKRLAERLTAEAEIRRAESEKEAQARRSEALASPNIAPALANPALLRGAAASQKGMRPSVDALFIATAPRRPRRKLQGHKSEINCLSFSRSGALFATGSNDKTVRLWDSHAGSVRKILQGPVQAIMSVAFSADDSLLLGTSNDSSMRVWSVVQGRCRHVLTGHTGKIYGGVFCGDGVRSAVSGGHDRAIKLWDLGKGYCVKSMFCFSSCNGVAVSPDGAVVYSGHFDAKVRLWDTRSAECIAELSGFHGGQVTSVSVSIDGSKLLSNSRDNTLRVFDTRTLKELHCLKADTYKTALNWGRACLSPDARFAAAGGSDGTVHVWGAESGKLEMTLAGEHRSAVASCDWGVTGTLASADKDCTVILWD